MASLHVNLHVTAGAAELGAQGMQLHTLILEVQSYKKLENRDLFIFFVAVAYSDLNCFRRPCFLIKGVMPVYGNFNFLDLLMRTNIYSVNCGCTYR